jgi:DegV family protein with EDD domain
MNKIKIVTDSTSDLRQETYDRYDIEVVPLLVNFGEESFKDRVEIDLKQLYDRVDHKRKQFPKTSSVSPAVFVEVFTKYIDKGYDILYIGIGNELSLTYGAAQMAMKEINRGNVRLVDSANLSTASGLLLMRAGELRDEGKTLDEIADEIQRLTKKMHTYFAVENLEFLYRGGRVSAGKYFLGTMVRAHPIIKVEGGKLSVYDTPKGKMVKALDVMLEEFYKIGPDKVDLGHVMLTHAFADDSVKYMMKKLTEMGIPEENIYVSTAGSVIGTHCGPNTIGILFIEK